MLPQFLFEQGGVIPAPMGWRRRANLAGKATHQIQRLSQLRRALVLALQQRQPRFHHIGLREAEVAAKELEGGVAGVIETHRNGSHQQQAATGAVLQRY